MKDTLERYKSFKDKEIAVASKYNIISRTEEEEQEEYEI